MCQISIDVNIEEKQDTLSISWFLYYWFIGSVSCWTYSDEIFKTENYNGKYDSILGIFKRLHNYSQFIITSSFEMVFLS